MGESGTRKDLRRRKKMAGDPGRSELSRFGSFPKPRRPLIVSASAAVVAMLILLAVFVPLGAPPQIDADPSVKEAGILSTYRKTYSVEGNFLEPVIGPSSPNDPTQEDGRLWIIVGQDTGLIEMNAVTSHGTPLVTSEPGVSIRIQDFGLSTPLSTLLHL